MSRLWEKGLPLDERVLRYTAGGTAVASMGIAVNRKWRSQAGEDKAGKAGCR